MKKIARLYKVSVEDLKGRSRKRPLPEARFLHWLILSNAGMHPTKIGEMYKRKRCTVLYGVKTITGIMKFDKELRKKCERLSTKIKR